MLEDLKKIVELAEMIKKLLDDPQPGMMSWYDFLKRPIQEIFNILWIAGVRYRPNR